MEATSKVNKTRKTIAQDTTVSKPHEVSIDGHKDGCYGFHRETHFHTAT